MRFTLMLLQLLKKNIFFPLSSIISQKNFLCTSCWMSGRCQSIKTYLVHYKIYVQDYMKIREANGSRYSKSLRWHMLNISWFSYILFAVWHMTNILEHLCNSWGNKIPQKIPGSFLVNLLSDHHLNSVATESGKTYLRFQLMLC